MPNCCAHCSSSSLGGEAASVCVECGSATIAGVAFSAPALLAVTAVAAGLVIFLPKLRSSATQFANATVKLISGRRDAASI